jgi:hypothetical protein
MSSRPALSGTGEECARLIGGADRELAEDLDLTCPEKGERLRGRIG